MPCCDTGLNFIAFERKIHHMGRTTKNQSPRETFMPRLRAETKKTIWAILFLCLGTLFALAGFHNAGPLGELLYQVLTVLLGWGYAALPVALFSVSAILFFTEGRKLLGITSFGTTLALISVLGLIELWSPGHGGWLGKVLSSLQIPFGHTAAVIMNIGVFVVGAVITLDVPIHFKFLRRLHAPSLDEPEEVTIPKITGESKETSKKSGVDLRAPEEDEATVAEAKSRPVLIKKMPAKNFGNYVPPPLSLLNASTEKPTTGDLRANANIIKRTLESFGIPVEMGEVNIGPKVTRYTLKPAEGMKLSRIIALHQDIALALAAHPIRIEAPIPGKSLVGIEVPNKAAAVVRLGSLMAYPEFQKSGPLGFIIGRDVTGEPIFADIEKMPHLLIAGATGSGKSVMIHSLIVSLLYKNSPETLRMAMIDPKRVELTMYDGIPHLIAPVITENKKAMSVFRWAIKEMEHRYELLQKAGSRDIKSYNANGGKDNPLPYLAIVIDELADLMTSYGREVEGSIVRLAQMARATGLHLILSTQRPSVEIITGLIKANITSRIALQVASQIDSRTILDTSGAEKLLGGGDLLFTSAEISKPKRIQGAYLSEDETRAVASFIRDNNKELAEESSEFMGEEPASPGAMNPFEEYLEGDDDELYEEALEVIRSAGKASASLLQRRLKVGYARAARLLDLMEAKGVIGPGEGAKPREVYIRGGEEIITDA